MDTTKYSRKNSRLTIVILCLLAGSLFALPFFPELQPLALGLRIAGVICVFFAFVATFFFYPSEKKTNILAGLALGIVAFVIAIALAFAQISPASANQFQQEITANAANETTTPKIVDYIEPNLDKIAEENKNLIELKYIGKKVLINKAEKANYEAHSKTKLVWDEAQAYLSGLTQIVSVPLESELKAANKVIFVWDRGTLTTQEIFGELKDTNSVHVRIWQNDELQENQLIINNNKSAIFDIATRGMNWGNLNSCLSNLGINWAVLAIISVGCTAACALTAGAGCIGCIGAMTGFTGGSIASCVEYAWK